MLFIWGGGSLGNSGNQNRSRSAVKVIQAVGAFPSTLFTSHYLFYQNYSDNFSLLPWLQVLVPLLQYLFDDCNSEVEDQEGIFVIASK